MHTLRYLWYRMKHRVIRYYEHLSTEQTVELRMNGLNSFEVLIIKHNGEHNSVVIDRYATYSFTAAKNLFEDDVIAVKAGIY